MLYNIIIFLLIVLFGIVCIYLQRSYVYKISLLEKKIIEVENKLKVLSKEENT